MNRTPIPRRSKKRLAAIAAGTYKPKPKKALKRTPLKKKRRVTGERALFVRLYEERGGVSEVSGKELLPPHSERFHYQGSHGLNKGMYPEYRLDDRNVFMITVEEHEVWHRFGDKEMLVKEDPRWRSILDKIATLKHEATIKYQRSGTT